ncbi:hypothetical protein T459_07677 [Capsicum annuum]|uniref:Retrotransposon gag domain-containing protein n=1 Tax=Capsicum annuum TaxID=4072 RepID=A0A2G2ZUE1_CAPAN|nr:hypothetical protein T459_07677 [Capsicum annuum]
MKVAVVGEGISGLVSAYELAKAGVEVVVYEKENYLGGHPNTVTVDGVDLDLGFMVFNRKNVLNPYFWQMIREIIRFKQDVTSYLEAIDNNPDIDHNETLGQFIESHGYSELFQKAYLIPICASIWTSSSAGVLGFSASYILSFCHDHHLLQLFGPPQLLTLRWRSHINKVKEELAKRGCQIRTSCEVNSVSTNEEDGGRRFSGEEQSGGVVVNGGNCDVYSLAHGRRSFKIREGKDCWFVSNWTRENIDTMMMPGESEGNIDIMMMPGESRGDIDTMMMPGESGENDDVMMMPGESARGNDVMMIPSEFGRGNDVMMPCGATLFKCMCIYVRDSRSRYNEWEDAKGDSAEPTVWDEFVEAFLNRLFPLELREAKEKEFMNLKKGKMSVQEYTLKFNHLAHYAPEMISSMRARMRKFASGLSDDLVLECQEAMLNKDLDFARLTVHMQQIEEKKKKISEARKKERQAKRARSADQGYSQPQRGK